jgi:hypothetical protein
MTHPELHAHYAERQLLNVVILVLLCLAAWAVDTGAKQTADYLNGRLTVAMEGTVR